jgi:hypothetical protein
VRKIAEHGHNIDVVEQRVGERDVEALVRVGEPERVVPNGIFGPLERKMRIGDDSQAQHAHARESRAPGYEAAIRLS